VGSSIRKGEKKSLQRLPGEGAGQHCLVLKEKTSGEEEGGEGKEIVGQSFAPRGKGSLRRYWKRARYRCDLREGQNQ